MRECRQYKQVARVAHRMRGGVPQGVSGEDLGRLCTDSHTSPRLVRLKRERGAPVERAARCGLQPPLPLPILASLHPLPGHAVQSEPRRGRGVLRLGAPRQCPPEKVGQRRAHPPLPPGAQLTASGAQGQEERYVSSVHNLPSLFPAHTLRHSSHPVGDPLSSCNRAACTRAPKPPNSALRALAPVAEGVCSRTLSPFLCLVALNPVKARRSLRGSI